MSDQGTEYSKFIEAELKAEHDRRNALDARAGSVTATSSGFLGLVVALSALVVGKEFTFSQWGARGVVAALASFAIASLLALIASNARRFDVAAAATLTAMLEAPRWMEDEVDARNRTAKLNVKTIGSLRNGTNTKATLLLWAIWLQFTGFVLLIVSTAAELSAFLK